jgi:hypothetical protein
MTHNSGPPKPQRAQPPARGALKSAFREAGSQPCTIASSAACASVDDSRDSASSVHGGLGRPAGTPASSGRDGARSGGGAAPSAPTSPEVSLLSAQLRGGSLESSAGPSREGSRRPAMRQGCLATALSREASVRNGQTRASISPHAPVHAVAEDVSGTSWGRRVTQFGTAAYRRCADSARQSEDAPRPAAAAAAASSSSNREVRFQPQELAAALSSLEESSPPAVAGAPVPAGVIAAEPPLATTHWGVGEGGSGGGGSQPPDGSPPARLTRPGSAPESDRRRRSVDCALRDGAGSSGDAGGVDGSPTGKEWNRRFVRRWTAVKRRARLQALGLRSLWKMSSPGRHEPNELLTNDPAVASGGSATAGRALPRRPSAAGAAEGMHRDPSLGTMLRGEVAELS